MFDLAGVPLRITAVTNHAPAPHPVLGWTVPGGGGKVAFFSDPDGNGLSLTQN